MDNDEQVTEDENSQSEFMSHLVELRNRLLRMLLVVTLVFLILFPFADDLYTQLASPLLNQLAENSSMQAIGVISSFLIPFKLVLLLSVAVTIPYLLYQIWAFIAPGLYKHERRFVFPLLFSSTLLFYLGMVFAYFVVFPLVFKFVIGIAPEGVTVQPDISYYLDFVLALFLAFGLAFEIPIATFLLVVMGITTPAKLSSIRPYVVVAAFVIGMFLTPPDVISQILLAIPMWILYELGIIFSRLFYHPEKIEDENNNDVEAVE